MATETTEATKDTPNTEKDKKLNQLKQNIKPLPKYIPLENFRQLFSDYEINLMTEEGIIVILTDNRVWKMIS